MNLYVDIVSHKLISNNKMFELKAIQTVIRGNSFCAIVGQSGSGKTTLLNMLAGLIAPQQGSIKIDNQSEIIKEMVEYIPIDNQVFLTLSVLDNLKLINEDLESINLMTDKLGIQSLLHKKVYQLSKGEKERVAVTRALLSPKPILLLDEPTANLDPNYSKVVFETLKMSSNNKLVIISTHQEGLANQYCNHTIKLKDGELSSETFPDNHDSVDLTLNYVKPQHFRLLFKLMFNQLVIHKPMFLLSVLFMSLVILGVFISTSLNHVNIERTRQNSLSQLKYTYYRGSDEAFNSLVTPNQYVSQTDALYEHTLKEIRGIDIDVIFQNNDTIQVFGKDITQYELPANYIDTDTDIYFPILVNQALLVKLELANFDLTVGDLLPTTFKYEGNTSIHFVIVDTFSITNEYHETNDDVFPSIIEEAAYHALIETSGINHQGIKESLRSELKNYNEYIIQNHPTKPTYTGYFSMMENYEIRLVNTSMVTTQFYDINDVPLTGGYYLVGNLPTNLNEIVVPSSFIYELFGPNPSGDAEIEHYRQTHSQSIHYVGDVYLNNSYFPSDFQVVGYYGYSGPHTVKTQDQVIIHDQLFNTLYEAITVEEYQTLSTTHHFYYPKTVIQSEIEAIKTGTLNINTNEIEQFDLAMENVVTLKNFITGITVLITIIATLFFWIYMSNYMKGFQNERLLLMLMGLSKTSIFKTLVLVFVSVYLPVLLLIYATSTVIENMISQAVTNPVHFPSPLLFDHGLTSLYVLLAFLFIMLLSFLSSLLEGNKKIISSIKDE